MSKHPKREHAQNAADHAQIEDLKEKERLAQMQAAGDLEWLLDKPHFRRFLLRLFGSTGVLNQSYTGNADTHFNEGARSVGLKLLTEINEVDPYTWPRMQIEHLDAQR